MSDNIIMLVNDMPLEFRRIKDLPESQREKVAVVNTPEKAGLLVALCSVTDPTHTFKILGGLSDDAFWDFFYELMKLNGLNPSG